MGQFMADDDRGIGRRDGRETQGSQHFPGRVAGVGGQEVIAGQRLHEPAEAEGIGPRGVIAEQPGEHHHRQRAHDLGGVLQRIEDPGLFVGIGPLVLAKEEIAQKDEGRHEHAKGGDHRAAHEEQPQGDQRHRRKEKKSTVFPDGLQRVHGALLAS